jgi:hypothetical protein
VQVVAHQICATWGVDAAAALAVEQHNRLIGKAACDGRCKLGWLSKRHSTALLIFQHVFNRSPFASYEVPLLTPKPSSSPTRPLRGEPNPAFPDTLKDYTNPLNRRAPFRCPRALQQPLRERTLLVGRALLLSDRNARNMTKSGFPIFGMSPKRGTLPRCKLFGNASTEARSMERARRCQRTFRRRPDIACSASTRRPPTRCRSEREQSRTISSPYIATAIGSC